MEISERISDIIRSKKTQLPTLSVVVDKILSIARDERASAKQLADFVEKDQAISSRVLRLANSTYYGQAKKVDSISKAITVVGLDETISLTLGMSVFSAFHQDGVDKPLDMKPLWLHSFGCAIAAKETANRTDSEVSEQVFLNGLLHDTGKIVFALFFPKEYRAVLEEARNSKVPLFILEKQMLGVDHAALSGLLMERWHFPDSLILPCLFHHDALACPPVSRNNARVVQLADFLCHKVDIGYSGNHVISDPEEAHVKLGLSKDKLGLLVTYLKEQRSRIEAFFQSLG